MNLKFTSRFDFHMNNNLVPQQVAGRGARDEQSSKSSAQAISGRC